MSFHTQGIRSISWKGPKPKPRRKKSKKDPAYEHWRKYSQRKKASS